MSLSILVINWQDIRNPYGGGAEVHLHEIFRRIAAAGHRVTLLCCSCNGAPPIETVDGIHIVRQGSRALFNYHVPGMYRRLVRTQQFDVVVDDINKIPFYTPLYVKQPIIGIVHHLFGKSIFLEAAWPAAVYVNLAERFIPHVYRRVPMAVVSESTSQELIHKGFNPNQLHIIHNGVDLNRYYQLPEHRSRTPLIGYLGRIKKYKSVDHLLEAFKLVHQRIPESRLLIIGDGDYLPVLRQQASRLELTNAILFTGAASETDKLRYLNQVWFTVNPSPKEGWGLTVIESNACGSPVIAADSPGLRDSVSDGYSGLLYPYGNIDRLASLIVQLINDEKRRTELRQNCVPWAQQFSWDVSAKKMIDLIRQTTTAL